MPIIPGGVITSRWGDPRPYGRHEGVDIAPRGDRRVFPLGAGVVERVGYMPRGYGRFVVVRHPNGYRSLYGHFDQIAVKPGQPITPRQPLGVAGQTGLATGIHTHLSVIGPDGRFLDPLRLPLEKLFARPAPFSPPVVSRQQTGCPPGTRPVPGIPGREPICLPEDKIAPQGYKYMAWPTIYPLNPPATSPVEPYRPTYALVPQDWTDRSGRLDPQTGFRQTKKKKRERPGGLIGGAIVDAFEYLTGPFVDYWTEHRYDIASIVLGQILIIAAVIRSEG